MPQPVRRRLTTLLAFIVLLGGCSDDGGPMEPDGLGLQLVVDGLEAPVFVTTAPGDDRLFVVERPGRIRIVDDGSVLPEAFLDISAETASGGERGLLGLAFHPQYATNRRFYVNHTDTGGDTRILEYYLTDPGPGAPSAMEVLLEIDQPFSNHNGGHLAFGPDGMLYIGMGDGGGGGDPLSHGQRPSTLLGSMLRIDVDAADPYGIPPDNPFVASPDTAPETWAYGLRNPWRFSFDRATGDLWIGDVGQREVEEISFQPASSTGGENYGWNVLEGSECFVSSPCDPSGTVLPVHEYGHDGACSVTGGYVYRGSAIPSLEGRYVFSDFCGGWIRSFVLSGGDATDVVDHSAELGTLTGVSSFGEDAAGELLVVSLDEGTIYRLVDGS